ncbi:unnamed protein product [Closterium sp. NIES-65]|nr:unnamed protein product [Closterium sp. NIES-65]
MGGGSMTGPERPCEKVTEMAGGGGVERGSVSMKDEGGICSAMRATQGGGVRAGRFGSVRSGVERIWSTEVMNYNESSDGESSGEEERRKRGSRGGAAGGEKDQEWSVHGSESESESGHAEEWRERNRDTRRGIESDDDGSDDSAGSHRFDESDGLNVADEAFKAHKADHAVEGEETDEMDEAEGAEEADEANDLTACCEHPDLLDMDDADLLAVLPSCLAFVEESVNCGEKVLVHCHAGVSRSAAVVTAYLMKLHRSTAEDALRLLQSKHPLACPNDGFLHQLRIFHSMGWVVDPHHPDYSRFKLRLMARRITGSLHHGEPIGPCPMGWAVNPHHSDYSRFKLRLMARRITGSLHQGVPFEAGNGAASNGDAISGDAQLRAGVGQEGECRQVVAAAANVLPHAPKPPASATDPAAGGAAAGGGDGAAAAGTGGEGGGGVRFRGKGKDWRSGAERGCTSVFVEPLKWMGDGEHGWEVVSAKRAGRRQAVMRPVLYSPWLFQLVGSTVQLWGVGHPSIPAA